MRVLTKRTIMAIITFLLVLVPLIGATASADSIIAEYSIPTSTSQPEGITSGPDGNVWFTEANPNARKIGKITPNGTITEFQVPASGNVNVNDITTGPDGNLWFTEGYDVSNIGRATTDGTITEFATPTDVADPIGITSGPDGNLWFTELTGNNIGQITTDGTITEFPVPTANSYPDHITAGPDGNLWFTEANANKIGKITPSGSITEYPIPNSPRFDDPQDITTGPDGNLWFTEPFSNRILKITPSGLFTSFNIPTNTHTLAGITTGSDGALWFTDQFANQVGRITTDGTVTQYSTPTSSSGPLFITTGPDHNLWFTETEANQIGRVAISQPTPVVQINSGGSAQGSFVADTDVSGGSTYTSSNSVDTSNVTNPAPSAVYQSVRYGNMTYTLPNLTPNANYLVRLHFNELYWGTSNSGNSGGGGSRVFNVAINGTQVLNHFDIFLTAGGADKALVKEFNATADSNGHITIDFSTVTDNAMVNGVEIDTPGSATPPQVSSLSLNAGGIGSGSFQSDDDYSGGTSYASTASVDTSGVTNPAPQSVYQTCRYGNMTYTIPNLIPNASYTIKLHFNELYWGTSLAGGSGGNGSRVFNVSINGTNVLNNFDIYQTAGGANKAIVESFTTNADSNGKITIDFTTVTDNAMVNGIELSH